MPPRCDGGVHRLETRRQQGAWVGHVPSQSCPKRVTFWLSLAAAGRCWPQLVAAGLLWLLHGDKLVILLAVPRSEVDDVKGFLRFDDVVERSRLVAEKIAIGGIHRKSRDGGGVDQARGTGANIFVKVWSPHDFGAVGGKRASKIRR